MVYVTVLKSTKERIRYRCRRIDRRDGGRNEMILGNRYYDGLTKKFTFRSV